jgi:uncharacterized protein (TIGR03083 family)
MPIRDTAMNELIATLNQVHSTAPTWCTGWSAHDIASHVGAAAQERANLIEEHVAGRPSRATRSWEEREPPFRSLDAATLRERLSEEAIRFETAVANLPDTAVISYTGWQMNAARLRMHSHSEAVLHRWDLVGNDDTSVRQLSEPALNDHALAAFAAIPLPEAKRWTVPPADAFLMRVERQPDIAAVKGSGLTRDVPAGDLPVIELQPHERPLMLWGRRPERLRNPQDPTETFDEMLARLLNRDPVAIDPSGTEHSQGRPPRVP